MRRIWRLPTGACGKILSGGDIGFAEALRDGWVDSADLTALLRLAIDNEQVVAKLMHSSGDRRPGAPHSPFAEPQPRRRAASATSMRTTISATSLSTVARQFVDLFFGAVCR